MNNRTPVINLYVSYQELGDLWEWTLLHESEFLGQVYRYWPHLRELPFGTGVRVILDTPESTKRLRHFLPANSVV